MSTVSYSPPAIFAVFNAIRAEIKQATLSGILGDAAHFAEGGYHVPRKYVGPGDYSVQLPQDRKGDVYAASALDVSYPPDLMRLVSRRLLAAGKRNDPRLNSMREFFGTVDGVRVCGWDRHNPDKASDDTPSTSDSSHLWHVHISFYREDATSEATLLPIADVVTGKPLKYQPDHPKWSDTVTEDELRAVVRDEQAQALRAVLQGGDHGYWTEADFPKLVKAEGNGVIDRLNRLEKAKP